MKIITYIIGFNGPSKLLLSGKSVVSLNKGVFEEDKSDSTPLGED